MFGRAGSTPRIKPSVGEDDSRGGHVFLVSDASKVIESIVIIRLYSKIFGAFFRIGIIVKLCSPEHILDSISVHGHCLVSASEYVPATHILIGGAISVDIIASRFVEGVIIFNGLSKCREEGAVWGEGVNGVEGDA